MKKFSIGCEKKRRVSVSQKNINYMAPCPEPAATKVAGECVDKHLANEGGGADTERQARESVIATVQTEGCKSTGVLVKCYVIKCLG